MKPILRSVAGFLIPAAPLAVACTLLTSGCVHLGAEHFEQPNYVPGTTAYGKVLPLRVAVAYPEEGVSAPTRDQDIEPIITARCPQGHTYISPRLEMSRGLVDELRATKAFQAVHWAPESFDDYDLVVRMRLTDGGKQFKSDICPGMLGPAQWSIVVLDQRGKELNRRMLTMAAINLYARSVVAQYRKDQQVFFAEAIKPILAAGESAAGAGDVAGDRALAYADKRAPELKAAREKLAAGKNTKLEREYLLKVAALESKRLIEEKTTESHQSFDDASWLQIQEQSRNELKQYGENVNKMLAQNFKMMFLGIANAGLQSGALGGQMPPELQHAATMAHDELARRVETAGGAQDMLGTLPKTLLPGHSAQLAADPSFGAEVAQSLQTTLGAPPPQQQ